MPILTQCRRCGVEFEPSRRAIASGLARLCPDCLDVESMLDARRARRATPRDRRRGAPSKEAR